MLITSYQHFTKDKKMKKLMFRRRRRRRKTKTKDEDERRRRKTKTKDENGVDQKRTVERRKLIFKTTCVREGATVAASPLTLQYGRPNVRAVNRD